ERALDEVAWNREPDALAAARRGVDLLVDADHVALAIQQGARGVARVDRGIGLNRVLDPEAGQRLHGAVRGRDNADRERLLLAERAADRRHGVAHLSGIGVA